MNKPTIVIFHWVAFSLWENKYVRVNLTLSSKIIRSVSQEQRYHRQIVFPLLIRIFFLRRKFIHTGVGVFSRRSIHKGKVFTQAYSGKRGPFFLFFSWSFLLPKVYSKLRNKDINAWLWSLPSSCSGTPRILKFRKWDLCKSSKSEYSQCSFVIMKVIKPFIAELLPRHFNIQMVSIIYFWDDTFYFSPSGTRILLKVCQIFKSTHFSSEKSLLTYFSSLKHLAIMVSNSTGLAVINSFPSFTQVHARISCDYELLLNLRDNYFALENLNSIVY